MQQRHASEKVTRRAQSLVCRSLRARHYVAGQHGIKKITPLQQRMTHTSYVHHLIISRRFLYETSVDDLYNIFDKKICCEQFFACHYIIMYGIVSLRIGMNRSDKVPLVYNFE